MQKSPHCLVPFLVLLILNAGERKAPHFAWMMAFRLLPESYVWIVSYQRLLHILQPGASQVLLSSPSSQELGPSLPSTCAFPGSFTTEVSADLPPGAGGGRAP